MAGAASALFLLDIKGRVLVWRDYRGDVSAVQAERFFTKLIEKELAADHGEIAYPHRRTTRGLSEHRRDLLRSQSKEEAFRSQIDPHRCRIEPRQGDPGLKIQLHTTMVFKHYFEELEEESLRDNFVVVYELLDEMMDFGYPQHSEAKILSEFIKTDAYRMEVAQRPPMAVTNAVSWRQ
ncbi:clathrin adaptor complexes medium subunit family protein [Actinidia rufa]|uniref:Clathrin adaptor complexes medium subunit family protein n=1 Tax=Actinidia rufa TaxID=165716 RepID=A0A7J0EYA0_9ERIC|nr:clathrin adaptor complexes medium subunit family protein [Actinidia rufa]